jgi:hypothetical protein
VNRYARSSLTEPRGDLKRKSHDEVDCGEDSVNSSAPIQWHGKLVPKSPPQSTRFGFAGLDIMS